MTTEQAVRQAAEISAGKSTEPKQCSAPDCLRGTRSRGMCAKHYNAWCASTPRQLRQPIDMSLTARFERKFARCAPDACWEWLGERNDQGYGRFRTEKHKYVMASTHSLTIFTGARPDGALALHHCDNPPCVNPQHLYWGTHQDNANDRGSRNRQARGSTNGRSRLTEAQVLELRTRFASGETARSIAESFGVSESVVFAAGKHMTWKHLGGPTRTTLKNINHRSKELDK